MSENTTNDIETQVEGEDATAKAKREARAAAEKRLRDENQGRLRTLLEEEHAKRGVEYKPRLTPEERAREDILRLAKQHGLSVALDVPTITEAQPVTEEPHSARIAAGLQSAAEEAREVPAETPVIDGDATPEERRAAATSQIFGQPSAY